MKKQLITIFVLFSAMFLNAQISTWDGTAEPWTNGSGTPEDPFLIESAQNFAYLVQQINESEPEIDTIATLVYDFFVDTCFLLTTDLDLGGNEGFIWDPIGGDFSTSGFSVHLWEAWFCGHFDGGGHTIYNMYIEHKNYSTSYYYLRNGYYFALFGQARYGSIKNITIDSNCSIDIETGFIPGNLKMFVGSILGYGMNLCVENCVNNSSVIINIRQAYDGIWCGGLFGALDWSTITNCHNRGDVYCRGCDAYATNFQKGMVSAGIVGGGIDNNIIGCTNRGNITCVKISTARPGKGIAAGGIIGNVWIHCNVELCYNGGTIQIIEEADAINLSICCGGIVGSAFSGPQPNYTTRMFIKNCYSVANLRAISHVEEDKWNFAGGIFGGSYDDGWGGCVYKTIENCYVVGAIEADTVGGILAKEGMFPFVNPYQQLGKDLIVSNSYYINTIESMNDYGTSVTEEYMKSAEFVDALNTDSIVFKMDDNNTNHGYPVFANGDPLSVEMHTSDKDVSIYPNPTSGIININCTNHSTCDFVEIYSLDGCFVKSQKVNCETIDISSLPRGVYIVKIRMADGKEFSKRIVKE